MTNSTSTSAIIEKVPCVKAAWEAAGRQINETFYEIAIDALAREVERLTEDVIAARKGEAPATVIIQTPNRDSHSWEQIFRVLENTPTANELIAWLQSLLTAEEKEVWKTRIQYGLRSELSETLRVALQSFHAALRVEGQIATHHRIRR